MRPIYEPKGAAKEYGDLALNIYTGCPHRCFYCFAPSVLRRDRERFHSDVRPWENIVEETRRQLEREGITGKLIYLCFTCDPYPTGYDTTVTREIIKLLKGDVLPYQGVEQEAEGKPWYLVVYKNQNAWVSSKYAVLVE